jgi:hypothetical protein
MVLLLRVLLLWLLWIQVNSFKAAQVLQATRQTLHVGNMQQSAPFMPLATAACQMPKSCCRSQTLPEAPLLVLLLLLCLLAECSSLLNVGMQKGECTSLQQQQYCSAVRPTAAAALGPPAHPLPAQPVLHRRSCVL